MVKKRWTLKNLEENLKKPGTNSKNLEENFQKTYGHPVHKVWIIMTLVCCETNYINCIEIWLKFLFANKLQYKQNSSKSDKIIVF